MMCYPSDKKITYFPPALCLFMLHCCGGFDDLRLAFFFPPIFHVFFVKNVWREMQNVSGLGGMARGNLFLDAAKALLRTPGRFLFFYPFWDIFYPFGAFFIPFGTFFPLWNFFGPLWDFFHPCWNFFTPFGTVFYPFWDLFLTRFGILFLFKKKRSLPLLGFFTPF